MEGMVNPSLASFALALLLVAPALTLTAQDTELRAERTVAFSPISKALPLNAKVGPVLVQTIQFLDRGRATGGSGVGGLMRTAPASEASSTLNVRFMAENPSPDEWAVTFTVEFLDKSGKVIDRVTKRSTWEGEARPYEFDHVLLQYVVPLIADVRIRFEAKLD
jgi:hypothetical protein